MKKLKMLFWIAILALATPSTSDEVLELTDGDFYSKIAENKHCLVLFYAPWCKRSKRLLPQYQQAAEELLKNNPPIALAQVDCTEDTDEICDRFAKDSYPTLKIFDDGEFVTDYKGPHTSYSIVKYMKAQIKPASKELSSVKDVEKFLKSSKEPLVIGFLAPNSAMSEVFKITSEKLKMKLQFAHCPFELSNETLITDKVILYRPLHLGNKFEDPSLTYSGVAEVSALSDFIKQNMHGLVGVRKLDNQEDFPYPLIIVYFDVDYEFNPKRTSYWRNRVFMVAKEFAEINFAISSNDEFAIELSTVGIDFVTSEQPIAVAKKSVNEKYVQQDEFSVDSLRKFANDFLKKNLKPFLRSEPVPKTQSEPVTVAVAKNFDKIVNRNQRDTLITFYAPWCGHCKNLAPTYRELAVKLQDENIAFVEMNAEANDVPPPYSVIAYPTIYWAPKNKKNNPIQYKGGRTVDDFLKFIAKEATDELRGWDREGNAKDVKLEL